MRQFETLYALDKKGKIRSFEIELIDYPNECIVIQTSTGLIDGKKVRKLTRITSGKVNRTVEQQAELVANSKYNEKLDEGYKSRETLNVRYRGEHGVETNSILELFKNITWNTSREGTPLPMLAQTFKDDGNWPKIGQPKLDGVRNIALARETDIRMCSRGGKFYTGLYHIEDEIKGILDMYPNLMFDGELYTHGVTQNEISGAARKQKREMFTDYTWLQYHVYDIPIIEGKEYRQANREEYRKELGKVFKDLKHVKFIESKIIHNAEEAKIYHDELVGRGYEGLILRDLDAPYMFSFRDKCLLKYKAFVVEEFKCVGRACQTGDISTFTLILSNGDGQTFGCRAKGSHALWQKYLDNPPIGQMVKVRYINRSAINNVPEKATVQPIKEYDKWE